MTHESAYGLWSLVLINSLVFIIFAFSFSKPQTQRDWRSFSAFSAFIVALFVEMYGFPLTIYLISGWVLKRYPSLDLFSHDAGHLWNTLLGWKINPHFDPLHIFSNILILGGFILLSASWKALYEAQKTHTLAITGPYAYVRHPQYAGFILIMLGFLFQWPTPVTLVMFPILVTMYVKLARREEKEVLAEFGDRYRRYMDSTPAFIPHFGRHQQMNEA
jgi:protein-S-isoprenylcysteine O-methyltransferase Ste14